MKHWSAGLLVMLAAGCTGGTRHAAASRTSGPAAAREGRPGVAAHVIRGREMQDVQNDLRQLAIFYQVFEVEAGRPPKTLDELRDSISKAMPALAQQIEEGRYVVELGGKGESGTRVLAYEKTPDLNGVHLVVLTDGSVSRMTPQELKAALARR